MGNLKLRSLMRYSLCAVPLLLLSLAGISHSALVPAPDKEQKFTSIEIINALRLNHYQYIEINDEFSNALLDAYLKELDPTKSYLLKSDIDEFKRYRFELDNALDKGDLKPAFIIFNRYQQRVQARNQWLLDELNKGIEQLDFTLNESFDPLNSEADWADSDAELDDMWRKRIKNNVLSLRLTDKNNADISALLKKRYENQLQLLERTNSNDAFEIYMNIVTQSYDPHTEYFAPHQSENFNISMKRSLDGIGAVLQYDQEYTKIVRLVPGGPADNTKQLHPADRIVGVAQGTDGEMTNVIGWRLDEVVNLIRGPKGTTVRLEIIPSGAANNQITKEISIVRNHVLLEEQSAKKQILEIGSGKDTRHIGVINIPAFYIDFEAYQKRDPNYVSTTRDVKVLLEELKKEKVDGVIIDLRNNGGGSLSEANSVVGLFIDKGATVQIKDARGRIDVLTDHNPDLTYGGPLAVVVNRLSASASEIFAGAIQDYQRGVVLGGQTFGKGTVQTLIPLRQGQLKITQSKFYRISGGSTQHQGVLPDITFPSLVDLTEIGEDVLKNALPWDTIRPVLHRKTGKISPYIAQLQDLHDKRIEQNADYQYRLEQIERMHQNRQETSISLNERQRKEQLESFNAWQIMAENKRREAKGLAKIKDLTELETQDAEDIESKDPYLIESAHILADYIRLSNQQFAQF